MSRLDTEQLQRFALEHGLAALGVTPAAAYEGTERDIAERAGQGLFADLKFTMARPEDSCHPERAIDDAASVISAALSYWAPDETDEPTSVTGPATAAGDHARAAGASSPTGRIARYTRWDAYARLHEVLTLIAEKLVEEGHAARVLVDSNFHVDREAAARSGVGFYGKHTNIITRTHGSWVVLGTIITSAALRPTDAMRPGCGSCTACIDACPTDAIAVDGGVLDVNRCITYWTQSRHVIPTDVREAMGDMVYGCDICQDVCPWNRGTEKRGAELPTVSGDVDLAEWLKRDGRELIDQYSRFFVPRRDAKFLRRNAIVALGNSGDPRAAALVAPFYRGSDAMLREHAEWALRKLGGPIAEAALNAGH